VGKPLAEVIRICLEAASGLQYLHSLYRPIMLGGMRGTSITISDEGKALLSDFELSQCGDLVCPSELISLNGWSRWLAPELNLQGIRAAEYRLSKRSDIWTWGMMTLELVSKKRPFYRNESLDFNPDALESLATGGMRPALEDYDLPQNAALVSLLESVWQEPEMRPDINEVVEKLGKLSSNEPRRLSLVA